MHEQHHHWGYTPPHWGTTGTPTTPNTMSTRSSGSIKRDLSEDDDDVFSEDSKDHCSSPGGDGTDSCQMLSRKKRRGIIEKRRRDRINTSLSELRRLVPTAYEKQGSAKLEKAEILQMTVDHLKMLHSKGMDSLAYDPSKFAMDYHNIGFRECAAEVARYLVTVEGFDIQDPLRLRLMSHLQCFAAQRELATKQPTQPTTPWYGATSTPTANPTYPHPPVSPLSGHLMPSHDTSSSVNSSYESSNTNNSCETSPPTSSSVNTSSTLTPLTTVSSVSYHHQGTYNPHMQSYHSQHHPHQHYDHNANQGGNTPLSSQMKQPYRPWGAEVAY